MRAQWDGMLEMWTADADPPGSGADLSCGPAGPAGVVVLRSPSATVSQCTMTGRVVSMWFEEDLGQPDRDLLGLFFAPGTVLPTSRADPAELDVLPVAERLDVARLAVLLDAEASIDRGPVSAARVLLHAELADVCAAVADRAPAAMAPATAQGHLARADQLVREAGWLTLDQGLPAGTTFDPLPAAARLDRLATGLVARLVAPGAEPGPTVELLRQTVRKLNDVPLTAGTLGAGADAADDLTASLTFRGLRSAQPSTDPIADQSVPGPPDLTALHNPDPQVGEVSVEVRIEPDGTFALGDLAPKHVGLRGTGGSLAVSDGWCTVTVPLDPSAPHPVSWWAIAKRGDRPVGAAPFALVGPDAVATFAVGDEQPDRLVVTSHPLRPTPTSALAQLETADRLGRAAWWARRRGDAVAATLMADTAIAWFELGRVFRAGWAWSLAGSEGQGVIRRRLAERADPESQAIAVAAMAAVAAAGTVPPAATVTLLPVPAWVLATDLQGFSRAVSDGTGGSGDR